MSPRNDVLYFAYILGGVYDRERKYFQHLPNLQFLATCLPPRRFGGSNEDRALGPRLVRRLNVINMQALSNDSLCTVYTNLYKAWLEEFPAYSLTHIEPFSKVCLGLFALRLISLLLLLLRDSWCYFTCNVI